MKNHAKNNWGNVHFIEELAVSYAEMLEEGARWDEEWAREEALEAAGIPYKPEPSPETDDESKGEDDEYGGWDDHVDIPYGVGDEIWTDANGYVQFGIITGIIRNFKGEPACYKVWRVEGGYSWEEGCFDYIQADHVYSYEVHGLGYMALEEIGYKLIDFGDPEDDVGYMKNEVIGDVTDIW